LVGGDEGGVDEGGVGEELGRVGEAVVQVVWPSRGVEDCGERKRETAKARRQSRWSKSYRNKATRDVPHS
jgi:hypothetical protein